MEDNRPDQPIFGFDIRINRTPPGSPYPTPEEARARQQAEDEQWRRIQSTLPIYSPRTEPTQQRGRANYTAFELRKPDVSALQRKVDNLQRHTDEIERLQREEAQLTRTLDDAVSNGTIRQYQSALQRVEELRRDRQSARQRLEDESNAYERMRNNMLQRPYYTATLDENNQNRIPPSPDRELLTHVNAHTYRYQNLQREYNELRGGIQLAARQDLAVENYRDPRTGHVDWGREQAAYNQALEMQRQAKMREQVAGGRDPLYTLWRYGNPQLSDFIQNQQNFPFLNRAVGMLQNEGANRTFASERGEDWARTLAGQATATRTEIDQRYPYPTTPEGSQLTSFMSRSSLSGVLSRIQGYGNDATSGGQPDPFWEQLGNRVRANPQWSPQDYYHFLTEIALPSAGDPSGARAALVRQEIARIESDAARNYQSTPSYQNQVERINRQRQEEYNRAQQVQLNDPRVQFIQQYSNLQGFYQPYGNNFPGFDQLDRDETKIGGASPSYLLDQYGLGRTMGRRENSAFEAQLERQFADWLIRNPANAIGQINSARAIRDPSFGAQFISPSPQALSALQVGGFRSTGQRFNYIPRNLNQPMGALSAQTRRMADREYEGQIGPFPDVLHEERFSRAERKEGNGYADYRIPNTWDYINALERRVLTSHIDPTWEGGDNQKVANAIRSTLSARGQYTAEGKVPGWLSAVLGSRIPRDMRSLLGNQQYLDYFQNLQSRVSGALGQMEEAGGYRNAPLASWYSKNIETEGAEWRRGPFGALEAQTINRDLRGLYLSQEDFGVMQRVDPDLADFTARFGGHNVPNWVWNSTKNDYERIASYSPDSWEGYQSEGLEGPLSFNQDYIDFLKAQNDPVAARMLELIFSGALKGKMAGIRGRSPEEEIRENLDWVAIAQPYLEKHGIDWESDPSFFRKDKELMARVAASEVHGRGIDPGFIISQQGGFVDLPYGVALDAGITNARKLPLGAYTTAEAARALRIPKGVILRSGTDSINTFAPMSLGHPDVAKAFLERMSELQSRIDADPGMSKALDQSMLDYRMRGSRHYVRAMRDALSNEQQGFNDGDSRMTMEGYRRRLRDQIEGELRRNLDLPSEREGQLVGQLEQFEKGVVQPLYGPQANRSFQTMSLGLEALAGALGYRDEGAKEHASYAAGVMKNLGNILAHGYSRGQSSPDDVVRRIATLTRLGEQFRNTGFITSSAARSGLLGIGWTQGRDPGFFNESLFLPGVQDRVHWSAMNVWRGEAGNLYRPGDHVQIRDPRTGELRTVRMGLLAGQGNQIGQYRDMGSLSMLAQAEAAKQWLLPKSWGALRKLGYSPEQFLHTPAERAFYANPEGRQNQRDLINRGAFFEGFGDGKFGGVYSVADIVGKIGPNGIEPAAFPNPYFAGANIEGGDTTLPRGRVAAPFEASVLRPNSPSYMDILDDWNPWNIKNFLNQYGVAGARVMEMEATRATARRRQERHGVTGGTLPFTLTGMDRTEQMQFWYGLGGGKEAYEAMALMGRIQQRGWMPDPRVRAQYLNSYGSYAGAFGSRGGPFGSVTSNRYDAYIGAPPSVAEMVALLPGYGSKYGMAEREYAHALIRGANGGLSIADIGGAANRTSVVPLNMDSIIAGLGEGQSVAAILHNHPIQHGLTDYQTWGMVSPSDFRNASEWYPNVPMYAYEPGLGPQGGFALFGDLDYEHMAPIVADYARHGSYIHPAALNRNEAHRLGQEGREEYLARAALIYRSQMGSPVMPGASELFVMPNALGIEQNASSWFNPALLRKGGQFLPYDPRQPVGLQKMQARTIADYLRQGFHSASPEDANEILSRITRQSGVPPWGRIQGGGEGPNAWNRYLSFISRYARSHQEMGAASAARGLADRGMMASRAGLLPFLEGMANDRWGEPRYADDWLNDQKNASNPFDEAMKAGSDPRNTNPAEITAEIRRMSGGQTPPIGIGGINHSSFGAPAHYETHPEFWAEMERQGVLGPGSATSFARNGRSDFWDQAALRGGLPFNTRNNSLLARMGRGIRGGLRNFFGLFGTMGGNLRYPPTFTRSAGIMEGWDRALADPYANWRQDATLLNHPAIDKYPIEYLAEIQKNWDQASIAERARYYGQHMPADSGMYADPFAVESSIGDQIRAAADYDPRGIEEQLRESHYAQINNVLDPEQRALLEQVGVPGSRLLINAPPGTGKSYSLAAGILREGVRDINDPRYIDPKHQLVLSATNKGVGAFKTQYETLRNRFGIGGDSPTMRNFHSQAYSLLRSPEGRWWVAQQHRGGAPIDFEHPYAIDDRFRHGYEPTAFKLNSEGKEERTVERLLGEALSRHGYFVNGVPRTDGRQPGDAGQLIQLKQLNEMASYIENQQQNHPDVYRKLLAEGQHEASAPIPAGGRPSNALAAYLLDREKFRSGAVTFTDWIEFANSMLESHGDRFARQIPSNIHVDEFQDNAGIMDKFVRNMLNVVETSGRDASLTMSGDPGQYIMGGRNIPPENIPSALEDVFGPLGRLGLSQTRRYRSQAQASFTNWLSKFAYKDSPNLTPAHELPIEQGEAMGPRILTHNASGNPLNYSAANREVAWRLVQAAGMDPNKLQEAVRSRKLFERSDFPAWYRANSTKGYDPENLGESVAAYFPTHRAARFFQHIAANELGFPSWLFGDPQTPNEEYPKGFIPIDVGTIQSGKGSTRDTVGSVLDWGQMWRDDPGAQRRLANVLGSRAADQAIIGMPANVLTPAQMGGIMGGWGTEEGAYYETRGRQSRTPSANYPPEIRGAIQQMMMETATAYGKKYGDNQGTREAVLGQFTSRGYTGLWGTPGRFPSDINSAILAAIRTGAQQTPVSVEVPHVADVASPIEAGLTAGLGVGAIEAARLEQMYGSVSGELPTLQRDAVTSIRGIPITGRHREQIPDPNLSSLAMGMMGMSGDGVAGNAIDAAERAQRHGPPPPPGGIPTRGPNTSPPLHGIPQGPQGSQGPQGGAPPNPAGNFNGNGGNNTFTFQQGAPPTIVINGGQNSFFSSPDGAGNRGGPPNRPPYGPSNNGNWNSYSSNPIRASLNSTAGMLGRSFARLGWELSFLSDYMGRFVDKALQESDQYRQAASQGDILTGAEITPAGISPWGGNMSGGENPVYAGYAKNFPMFSRSQTQQAITATLSTLGLYGNAGSPGATQPIMNTLLGLSAMSGIDVEQLVQEGGLAGAGLFQGAGSQQSATLMALAQAIQLGGGTLTQQSAGPIFQALQALNPLSFVTGEGAGDVYSYLQLAQQSGVPTVALPLAAQAVGTLYGAGYSPNLGQQLSLLQLANGNPLLSDTTFGGPGSYNPSSTGGFWSLGIPPTNGGKGNNIYSFLDSFANSLRNNSLATPEAAQFLQSQISQTEKIFEGKNDIQFNVPQLRIDAVNAQINLESAQLGQQATDLAYGYAKYYFGLAKDEQLYGPIGATASQTGRTAYFDFERSALLAGYDPTKADYAGNFRPNPAFGLRNEEFYAGVEHQRSELVLGRSKLTSDLAFQENLKYLNMQENFYQRELEIQNEQRAFDKEWGLKLLEAQGAVVGANAKMLEINKALAAAQIPVLELQKRLLPLQIIAMESQQSGEILRALGYGGGPNGQAMKPSDILRELVQYSQVASADQMHAIIMSIMGGDAGQAGIIEQMIAKLRADPTLLDKNASAYNADSTLKQFLKNYNDALNSGAFTGAINTAGKSDAYLALLQDPTVLSRLQSTIQETNQVLSQMAGALGPLSPALYIFSAALATATPALFAFGAGENIFATIRGILGLGGGATVAGGGFAAESMIGGEAVAGSGLLAGAAPIAAPAAGVAAGVAAMIADAGVALDITSVGRGNKPGQFLTDAKNSIVDIFTGNKDQLSGDLKKVWTEIYGKAAVDAFTAIPDQIGAAFGKVDWRKSLQKGTLFSDLGHAIGDGLGKVDWGTILGGVTSIPGSLGSGFLKLVQKINWRNVAHGTMDLFVSGINLAIDGLIAGAKGGLHIAEWFRSLNWSKIGADAWTAITNAFKPETLSKTWDAIRNGITNGLIQAADSIKNFAQFLRYELATELNKILDHLRDDTHGFLNWHVDPGKKPPGYAMGGRVPYSQFAMVGEHGPELVALPGNSYVHSNESILSALSKNSGSKTVTINLTVNGSTSSYSTKDKDDIAEAALQALSQALKGI